MGKIGEFYKNMSGKYQEIFNLFHNIKKITEMMLYKKKELFMKTTLMSTFAIF